MRYEGSLIKHTGWKSENKNKRPGLSTNDDNAKRQRIKHDCVGFLVFMPKHLIKVSRKNIIRFNFNSISI